MTRETADLLMHFARPQDLSAEERAELDAFVKANPDCAAKYDAARSSDAVIASAMKSVTIPIGFRDALQNQAISKLNALWWKRWLGRTAGLAALLITGLLGVSGYLAATRATFDSDEYLIQFEGQNTAFESWRTEERLPSLPTEFDTRLVTFTGQRPLNGVQVPTVRLNNQGQSAFVYFVKDTRFNLKNATDTIGSNGGVRVYRDQPGGYTLIVVYTGTSLSPFMHNPADFS